MITGWAELYPNVRAAIPIADGLVNMMTPAAMASAEGTALALEVRSVAGELVCNINTTHIPWKQGLYWNCRNKKGLLIDPGNYYVGVTVGSEAQTMRWIYFYG